MPEKLKRRLLVTVLVILTWCLPPFVYFGRQSFAADSVSNSNRFELLSYQFSNYKYMILPPNTAPPPGFERLEFDHSAAENIAAVIKADPRNLVTVATELV